MKLKYWYAQRLGDGDCYSALGKTKKSVASQVAEHRPGTFGPIEKKELDYADAFDLFDWATSEGGGRGCGNTV